MKRIALLISLLAAAGAADAGRLATLEVYDRTRNESLPVYWHQGRAWVAGQPGNEYRVTLRNHAGQDLLAVVSVDGVNVVTGESASPRQSGYVVDAGGAMAIDGWRKSLARTAAFYFTALPDSYAARTGRPHDVGVIGAALYRRKHLPPPVSVAPAPAEPLASGAARDEGAREGAAAARQKSFAPQGERLGTGHGRGEHSPAQYTSFERATREPEEVLTVFYDSHANLVARGIIPRSAWFDPPVEPRPFPGRFAPDPPR